METKKDNLFLVVGLGNPGNEYEKTKHNLGFRTVDLLFEQFRKDQEAEAAPGFEMKKRHKSLVAEVVMSSHKTLLVKPQTFMNLSGVAVQSIFSFFKIAPEKLLIIHDDIDLEFGTIRLSRDCGPAGHNGVSSIIEKLGTKEFTRLRIGVGRSKNEKGDSSVLKKFSAEENQKIDSEILPNAAKAALVFVENGYEKTASKYNGLFASQK